jgi:hypothetical protein
MAEAVNVKMKMEKKAGCGKYLGEILPADFQVSC